MSNGAAMTCPRCGRPLTNGKCRACIGKASRAKGNRGQREAAAFLNQLWLKWGITEAQARAVVSGISQRRAWDKGVPDLTVTLPCETCGGTGYNDAEQQAWDIAGAPEPTCSRCHGTGKRILHGEVKCRADLPAWLWGRGPKRKPSLLWWEWLEGVRCESCYQYSNEKCKCHGTGWLSHRHDFAMIRRTAKRGEAAYDWLVLTQKWGPHTLPGWDCAIDETLHIMFHPRDATEEHNSIVVIPADKWARAVVKES